MLINNQNEQWIMGLKAYFDKLMYFWFMTCQAHSTLTFGCVWREELSENSYIKMKQHFLMTSQATIKAVIENRVFFLLQWINGGVIMKNSLSENNEPIRNI